MARVYVGSIDPRSTERDLEDEFRRFGVLRSVWVARKPPGFAFIEFEDRRDAEDAIRELNGRSGWRVEMSRASGGPGPGRDREGGREGGRRGAEDMKCYECGEPGHFARECRVRLGGGGRDRDRGRSRSPPRYRRSPSYGRSGGRSPSPYRRRSPSPSYRLSPRDRRRSPSPEERKRERSPSPRPRSPSP